MENFAIRQRSLQPRNTSFGHPRATQDKRFELGELGQLLQPGIGHFSALKVKISELREFGEVRKCGIADLLLFQEWVLGGREEAAVVARDT